MEVSFVPDSQDLWATYGPLVVTAVALALGFVAVRLTYLVLRRLGRRVPRVRLMARRTHRPAQVLVALLMARFSVHVWTDTGAWRDPLLKALLVAVIAAVGWLVASAVLTAFETAQARLGHDVVTSLHARRANTQLVVLRRVTVAVVGVLTVGAALYTFDSVKHIGTSVLASAGVIGVVAGLAAQSTLGNLIAGLQLAFGDRLRIGDVVVVEGEWGTVDEITLGYIVVKIWDQRRLILPTSYFTTTPFTSWNRRDSEILGTVELDLDWTVPVAELREELKRYVAGHPLWDRSAVSLQVTEATGGMVKVRALASAPDGSAVWDLRCDVREHLVEWLRQHHPEAMPRTRTELSGPDGAPGVLPPQPRHMADEASAASP
jgi:small-conductance mechanosensitive channel